MPTTPALVRGIYPTQKSDGELAQFVDLANLIVSEDMAESGYSTSRSDQIATWLAAHYLDISERGGAIRKRLGDADESYQDTGSGLNSTPFGAQALALDVDGILAALQATSKLRALFEVI